MALLAGSRVAGLYRGLKAQERFRHRYEFNPLYKDTFEAGGMVFSGWAPGQPIIQIAELPDHPFFVGVQFHPEFTSRPARPNPLFHSFVAACTARRRARAGGAPAETAAAAADGGGPGGAFGDRLSRTTDRLVAAAGGGVADSGGGGGLPSTVDRSREAAGTSADAAYRARHADANGEHAVTARTAGSPDGGAAAAVGDGADGGIVPHTADHLPAAAGISADTVDRRAYDAGANDERASSARPARAPDGGAADRRTPGCAVPADAPPRRRKA